MRGLNRLLLALSLLLLPTNALATTGDKQFQKEVNSFVEAEMRRQKIPGLAIAIIQDGKVVVAKGFGSANVEHRVPVTRTTMFQSGSVGKMFTAAAVMLQVEKGRLALDRSVLDYLPEGPASWRAVTIRHLLTHTSGIPDYSPKEIDYRRDYTEDELANVAYRMPLAFKPGEWWSYSNTAYVLLGIIVRKASGRFYGNVLKEEIFTPIGMKTARNISEADIVPNRAAGYRLVAGELKNQEWVSPSLNTTADGSLYVSLEDLIAWDGAVRRGSVLSPSSWSQTYTPVLLNNGKTYPYGFGWAVDQVAGHLRYSHGGAWQGFKTHISRYLADNLSVIVLTNLADADPKRFVDGISRLHQQKKNGS